MAVIDRNLTFSDRQLVAMEQAGFDDLLYQWDYYVSDNIIDIGEYATDTWGSGQKIYPGWWEASKIHVAIYSKFASTGTGDFKVLVRGVSTAASATAGFIGGLTYAASGTVPFSMFYNTGKLVWDVVIPSFHHRFMYLKYGLLSVNSLYLNSFIEIGDGLQWRRTIQF